MKVYNVRKYNGYAVSNYSGRNRGTGLQGLFVLAALVYWLIHNIF